MARHGKKYRAVAGKVDRSKRYTIEEAVQLVRELKVAKFDESVDVAVNLGVDPRHADQMVRGAVVLPHGTGKAIRVAVFAKGDKAKEGRGGRRRHRRCGGSRCQDRAGFPRIRQGHRHAGHDGRGWPAG